MTTKRTYYLLVGLLGLLSLGLVATAYSTNNLLVKQSTKLVEVKARLAALNQEQSELAKSKKDIATYANLYNISKTVVPQSKNQVQAVRQIVNLAGQTGVSLQSITFPSSTLGSGSATTTAPASAAGPTVAVGNPSLSQLKPVPKIPGVYDLQLVVTSSTDTGSLATYQELIDFLAALEQNRLTALVSTIAISPGGQATPTTVTSHTLFSFILTLDIYIKP
jgi:hypothetical protein